MGMFDNAKFKVGDKVCYKTFKSGNPMVITVVNRVCGDVPKNGSYWRYIYQFSGGSLGANEWVEEDYIEKVVPLKTYEQVITVYARDKDEAILLLRHGGVTTPFRGTPQVREVQ